MSGGVDAGYSGTPLIKKIGIKPGHRVCFVSAPDNWPELLGPLPEDVAHAESELDVAVLFVTTQDDLLELFPKYQANLAPKGMLWVAWPKKAANVPTDLSFDPVQKIGLASGLVDVKICAIDAIWSGLKFLHRRNQPM